MQQTTMPSLRLPVGNGNRWRYMCLGGVTKLVELALSSMRSFYCWACVVCCLCSPVAPGPGLSPSPAGSVDRYPAISGVG